MCRKPLYKGLYCASLNSTLWIRLKVLWCMIRPQVPFLEVRIDLINISLRSIITKDLA